MTVIRPSKSKCIRLATVPHSGKEVTSLVVLMVLLGGATALLLNYSFYHRGDMAQDTVSATIFLPKHSFAIGEEISGNFTIVNTSASEMILEKIEYKVFIYVVNNSSSIKEIYNSSRVSNFESSIVIKPNSMRVINIDDIWGTKRYGG